MALDKAVADLVARLEAVSGRLTSVESKLAGGAVPATGGASAAAASSAAAAAADDGEVAPSVADYDAIIENHIAVLEAKTAIVGTAMMKEQVGVFADAVRDQRKLMDIVSKSKKPSPADFQPLIAECGALMAKVAEIRNKSHKSEPDFNHLSSLSECVQALQWVCHNKAETGRVPAPVAKELTDGAAFYFNPILMKHKEGKPDHNEDQVAWVNAVKGFCADLVEYIKKHHSTGLSWNPAGGDAKSATSSAPAAKPAAAAAAKPAAAAAASDASGAAKGGLFAELNRGGAVTGGLKKVTKDMQTHKNPNLRAGGVVAASSEPKAAPAKKWGAAGSSAATTKPPVFALQGNKWAVEWQNNVSAPIVISDNEAKQTLYIFKCENCVVKVDGAKINAITIDSCKKVGVVFNTVISGVEIINSQSVQVQAIGAIPNFAIDKCTSVNVILSNESLHAQVVTSKSDSVNITVPDGEDIKEMPVPEQFITTYDGKELTTTTVKHE